jgi:hypothetical protein
VASRPRFRPWERGASPALQTSYMSHMSPLGLRTGETPARPGFFHGFSDAGHKSVSSVILSGAEILIGLVLSVYILVASFVMASFRPFFQHSSWSRSCRLPNNTPIFE